METRKGSSTFRIHLARISIDGVDEPVGREATLCLRLQQDQTTIPNLSQQLMDIYIDGRLMACWDFALLKQHVSYHQIHIFSSFTLSKHISLTLPLPLKPQDVPQDYDDCLKVIRVYFTKAQDFHTVISWLSTKAGLKRLDGRPATALGVRNPVSTTREKSPRPAVRHSMAPLAQHSVSMSQETPDSWPQSRSGQHPSTQQNGPHQSQLSSLGIQTPTIQLNPRSTSRGQIRSTMRQAVHDIPFQQRQPILRQNEFAAQAAGLSSMGPPPRGDRAFGDHEVSSLQMPRVGILPKRTMSAAPTRSRLSMSYSRGGDRRFIAPSPTTFHAPNGRHSPYNLRDYTRGIPSPDSSQDSPIVGSLYVPFNNFEPVRDVTSRHSQIQRLPSRSTQSTIAADSIDVDDAYTHDDVPHDTVPKRRFMSITSTDPMTSKERSTTSSQVAQVFNMPPKISSPPSITLLDSTVVSGHDGLEQQLGFEGASESRTSDQRQDDRVDGDRSSSIQGLQAVSDKKRKANQTLKRAGRRTRHDQPTSVQASAISSELQMEASGPASLVSPTVGSESTAIAVCASDESRMVDCATQTDSWPRLQATILHLSSAVRLDSRLLQDTKQWGTLEDVNQGLLRLSTQFVQGIYDISRST